MIMMQPSCCETRIKNYASNITKPLSFTMTSSDFPIPILENDRNMEFLMLLITFAYFSQYQRNKCY